MQKPRVSEINRTLKIKEGRKMKTKAIALIMRQNSKKEYHSAEKLQLIWPRNMNRRKVLTCFERRKSQSTWYDSSCVNLPQEKKRTLLWSQWKVKLPLFWPRGSSEEQVWTNNGCVFKLEEEVMLWLKLTPTYLACNEYKTSREMY